MSASACLMDPSASTMYQVNENFVSIQQAFKFPSYTVAYKFILNLDALNTQTALAYGQCGNYSNIIMKIGK